MLPKLFNFSFDTYLACVYRSSFDSFSGYFKPISDFKSTHKLIGLETEITSLMRNTQAFIDGYEACNALLWGARGCGKSSCMKYVLSTFLSHNTPLRVIELSKETLGILPMVQDYVRTLPYKFIILCDDLYFEQNEQGYKSLKSTLEGAFENKADNILFYTTSNHRHLIAESYPQDTLHFNDAQDEILSLSDRFGLVLGFYTLGRNEFIAFIETTLQTSLSAEQKAKALQFSTLKGSCNPRIANEFCTLMRNAIL